MVVTWNLSLEEGWDEPWAYVGYFHGEQASENKVIQRIGRLIRNPFKDEEGLPMLSSLEPLRSVYCYLNTTNNILNAVVARLQNEMNTSCLEILVVKELIQEQNTLFVPVKTAQTIPKLGITFDPIALEKNLFNTLFDSVNIHEDDYIAPGKAVTLTMDIGATDNINKTESRLEENSPATIGDVIRSYLASQDARLIRKRGSVGAWLSPLFWNKYKELHKKLNYSSNAYYEFRRRCDAFIDKLDELLFIDLDNDQDNPFIVEPIKLINPNGGDTETKKKHYKVHSFKHGVHAQYNGLNDLELDIAKALDQCNIVWARNPARIGYGIPLIQSDNSSTMFYPDFIAWINNKVFFIETKGQHLIEDAKKKKLTQLPKGLSLGVITYEHDTYTLITQGKDNQHKKSYPVVKKLLNDFLQI